MKRPYGVAKPVPLPPGFGSGPSGPVYSRPPFSGPSYGSHPPFNGPPPSFSGPPPSFNGPYPGYKKPGYIHGSKPVYEIGIDGETEYEDKYIEKKQVVVAQGSGVQQHVHHHYVHGEGAGDKSPIILGGTAGATSGAGYGYGNGGTYGNTFNEFEDYKKAFNTKGPSSGNKIQGSSINNYADKYPAYEKPQTGPFFNGQKNPETGKQLNSGFGINNGFGSSNNIGSSNSFGSSNGFGSNGLGSNGLESNNNFGSNNFGSNNFGSSNFGTNNFGSSNGFGNAIGSNNYDDCVCVPYDQCTTLNQAGRKDDLYLAIDPRNLGKDIEAESAVVTDGNGTMSIVRVTKEAVETDLTKETKNENKKEDSVDKKNNEENKERTKRDAQHVDASNDKKPEAEGVSIYFDTRI